MSRMQSVLSGGAGGAVGTKEAYGMLVDWPKKRLSRGELDA